MIVVLRFNLPPDEVRGHVTWNDKANVLERMGGEVAFSQTIAQWRYYDLLVVKFARSERVKATLIGLPFCNWRKV